MSAFLALVRKDIKLYFSNRKALIITLALPIAIAALFGSMFGGGDKKPTAVPIAILDLDASTTSQAIVAGLKAEPMLEVRAIGAVEAITEVRRGKLRAVITIPPGFGKDAGRAMFSPGKKPAIEVRYDPSQAMVLPMVRGMLAQYAMKALSRAMFSSGGALTDYRRELQASQDLAEPLRRDLINLFDSVERVQQRSAGATAATMPGSAEPFITTASEVTSDLQRKYNPYAHSFGGMSVQFLMFLGIEFGMGMLLARRLGLWKRLRAAPLGRATLLGSSAVSSTLIGSMLMLFVFAVGIAAFGVRIDGSVAGFLLIVAAFAILNASFGLLLAAVGNDPESTRGLAIFATLLLVMLGGAWVPSFVFPAWLQGVTAFVPTRWAVDGLAAMTWRGQGFEAALAPVGYMLAFSAVTFTLALWRFRWEE